MYSGDPGSLVRYSRSRQEGAEGVMLLLTEYAQNHACDCSQAVMMFDTHLANMRDCKDMALSSAALAAAFASASVLVSSVLGFV